MTVETVVMEHDFGASPARLFAAWTQVDVLRQWFGRASARLWNVHAWDVRPGGPIHVSLDFDDGPFEVRGEFPVVDPPGRPTYRWRAPRGSAGVVEIAGCIPGERVVAIVNFVRPFKVTNENTFFLERTRSMTTVTWSMSGPKPWLARLFGIVFDMDRMMAKHFDAGLDAIKRSAEGTGS